MTIRLERWTLVTLAAATALISATACNDVEYSRWRSEAEPTAPARVTDEAPDPGGDTGPTCCATAPEASAADDGRPTGIYKGVTNGSDCSTVVRVVIPVDGTPYAELVEDGEATGSLHHEMSNDGATIEYQFFWDEMKLVLVLSAEDGEVIASRMEGTECTQANVFKESSSELVMGYLGTWQGSGYEGTFNFAVRDGELEGTFDGDVAGTYVGTVEGGEVLVHDILMMGSGWGTIDEQRTEGTWDVAGFTGTWEGARRL